MSNVLPKDGEIHYFPGFLLPQEADRFFEQLNLETDWLSKNVKIFGKVFPQPRLVSWVGHPEMTYTYSGLELQPKPWTNTLSELKKRIEKFTQHQFNSVLLNLYRNENDSNGWHSDNEKELGKSPVIASLSLGETRDFLLKHRTNEELKLKFPLENGSLLVMKGQTQKYWKHSLPKRSRKLRPRINLTFRKIITDISK